MQPPAAGQYATVLGTRRSAVVPSTERGVVAAGESRAFRPVSTPFGPTIHAATAAEDGEPSHSLDTPMG